MKRARAILESFGNAEPIRNDSGEYRLNEKVEISTEQAAEIKSIFAKAGFNIDITQSTAGSMYIEGLYNCGGRYVGIGFDKGGFLLSINCHSGLGAVITHVEALKMQKELKTMTDILEKIKAINPELL